MNDQKRFRSRSDRIGRAKTTMRENLATPEFRAELASLSPTALADMLSCLECLETASA